MILDSFDEYFIFCSLCVVLVVIFNTKRNVMMSVDLGFVYFLKRIVIYTILKCAALFTHQERLSILPTSEEEKLESCSHWLKDKVSNTDSMLMYGVDSSGNCILAEIVRSRYHTAITRIRMRLACGVIYDIPEPHVSACDDWTTDTLRFERLEPMRKWRVFFNGRLSALPQDMDLVQWNTEQNKSCPYQSHTRFEMLYPLLQCCDTEEGDITPQNASKIKKWTSLNGPYIYRRDCDLWLLSGALAQAGLLNWKCSLDDIGGGYEQFGVLTGKIIVDDIPSDMLVLTAVRQRCWGFSDMIARRNIIGFTENGAIFSLTFVSGKFKTQFGVMRLPDGRINRISMPNSPESALLTGMKQFVINFWCGHEEYCAVVHQAQTRQWGARKWASFQCTLNSQQAIGIIQSWKRGLNELIPPLALLHEENLNSDKFVIPLDSEACTNSDLVGGKAASLALLTEAANTLLKHKAVVPKGFCLTVHAMYLQLQFSEKLSAAVKYLEMVASGDEMGSLQAECQHVVSAWVVEPMCNQLMCEVMERVNPSIGYAVRSSAIGEDSGKLSSAGQNATILSCWGSEAVAAAVQKCWASLFTFQSVQYRRQYGLPINCGMGVVIQEMVAAEAAGVMFTVHPVTGDPSQLYISANYGIGESVVSAAVEPDSILVNRENTSKLKIVSSVPGRKDHKITMQDDGCLITEEVKPEEGQKLCISQPEIIAIAHTGILLESLFGWPRDIEWAINKGIIHLLQCRPITSLSSWSEEELAHELDSGFLPNDVTTTANAGEVFPGAVSPLAQSLVIRAINQYLIKDEELKEGIRHKHWYNNNYVPTANHHAFLSVLNTILLRLNRQPDLEQRVTELAVCGHYIATDKIQQVAFSRNGAFTGLYKAKIMYSVFKDMLLNGSKVRSALKVTTNFRMNCDKYSSSRMLYDFITKNLRHLETATINHLRVSRVNVSWQIILLSVLTEGQTELTSSHFEDISRLLLSATNVISASIPSALEEIRNVISQNDKSEEFTKIPASQVSEWLKANCPLAKQLVTKFLTNHGHRSIKDMDVMTATWGLNPTALFANLQVLVSSSRSESRVDFNNNNDDERNVISQLKTPRKEFTRKVLYWLLSWSRSSAESREITKNALLTVIHQLRLSYRRLGTLMMRDGRLPSPDLIFYCTHYEIGQLLSTRDPVIIHKASRRKHYWSKWDCLQFPEVFSGLPVPLKFNITDKQDIEGDEVKGTLVYPGQVSGRACVIKVGDSTSQVCQGDILITYSTDVGWSPLFPLLAGVVTELGGLISHGAVVAREYGLPCIIGATGATKVFSTGDKVLLDGSKGTVKKIK